MNFGLWLKENINSLKANSCIRDKNSMTWEAVGYINKWPVNPGDTLQDYFKSWEQACPERLKLIVKEICELIGIVPNKLLNKDKN